MRNFRFGRTWHSERGIHPAGMFALAHVPEFSDALVTHERSCGLKAALLNSQYENRGGFRRRAF